MGINPESDKSSKPARACTGELSVRAVAISATVALLSATKPVFGTGLHTCDSGAPETWKPKESLEKQLAAAGWKINRIKVDGGCYEVYAIDEQGRRVEAYFNPRTLDRVHSATR